MKNLLFIMLLGISTTLFAQHKPAYIIYNAKGEQVSYKDMLEKSASADLLLFGELHNNPICHWLQHELTRDIFFYYNENIVLGAEMYEADNQELLNEFLTKKITPKSFKEQARLWPNNETDYQPLLNFAREHNLHFIAANVPRRYANMVYKDGFEALSSLSPEAKKWIAPLPIAFDNDLPGYKNMREMMGGHGGDNISKSQALKDATMAHFILKNMPKKGIFIHYNGTYHSNHYEGIVWYVKREKPATKVITIASIEQEDVFTLNKENLNMADFILCIPSSMTKTH